MMASEFCEKFSRSSKRQLRFIRSFVLRTIFFLSMLEPSALVAVQTPLEIICSMGIIQNQRDEEPQRRCPSSAVVCKCRTLGITLYLWRDDRHSLSYTICQS
jgi:hypothetical protein